MRPSARRTGLPGSESRMKSCFLVDCGSAGSSSSPSATGGRSRGRKLDQTTSASAAARKAGDTAAARQASRGPVRASVADRRSSGSGRAPSTPSVPPTRLVSPERCGHVGNWGSTQDRTGLQPRANGMEEYSWAGRTQTNASFGHGQGIRLYNNTTAAAKFESEGKYVHAGREAMTCGVPSGSRLARRRH
jgi:hypothetical protein